MSKFNIRVTGLNEAKKGMDRGATGMSERINTVLKRYGHKIVSHIKRDRLSRQTLKVRTGRLRASIGYMSVVAGTVFKFIIGAGTKYAKIHELGGTIRPVRRKYLTIPLKAALTAAGAQRFTAADLATADTFFLRTDTGKLLLMGKTGPKKAVPLFLLVKQVKIKKRPYLRPGVIQHMPALAEDLAKAITGKKGAAQ